MTMMIEITMATMGRLMKNFDMVYLPSLLALGLPPLSWPVRLVCTGLICVSLFRSGGMGMNRDAVHQLARTLGDDLLSRL